MSGDSVQVNPTDLWNYGNDMVLDAAGKLTDLSTTVTSISQNTAMGLGASAGTAGMFLEGLGAMHLINRNLHEFGAFFKDLGVGLFAIQQASTAMAVAYAVTDNDSEVSLSTVDFAFVDGGTAPKGYPTKGVTTMGDQARADAAAAGQTTDAEMAANDPTMIQFAVSRFERDDHCTYLFADGSSLEWDATYDDSSAFISSSTTTVKIYDGKSSDPVSVTTTSTSSDYAGDQTTTTTVQTRDAAGHTLTSSEGTTHETDGSTVVNTTTTDATGKQTTTTVTATPQNNPASQDPGAIAQIEAKYHTKGDTANYGLGID